MLRIGVTGHRILVEKENLKDSINAVLYRISQTFPNREWLFLSSLAEGADCLIVERALKFSNASLQAVLPLPKDAFFLTFINDSYREMAKSFLRVAKVKVIPPQSTTELAYRAAGHYLVKHSDILIAIWDGRPAQGVGGAGEIVELARKQGKPLAWIKAGNRIPGTNQATTLGTEQGKIIFEHFSFF